jgi:hypothetical protein
MKTTIRLICTTLAAILPTGFAEARIGATPEECKAAYGTVRETRADGSKISYRRDGVLTDCWFLNGRCEMVSYQILPAGMVDRPEFGKEPRFSKDQSMALLNLNRGASTWSQVSKDKYGVDYDGIYATADGKIRASVSSVRVAVEGEETTEMWKKMITDQAVTETIASFSQGTPNGPEIPQDAPLPPPTEEELETQRNFAQMEQGLEDLKRSQEEQQEAFDKLGEVLTTVAARAAKKEEIQRHMDALKAIQEELKQSKTDADRIAAREKESEWVATANRLASEYEALKGDGAKGE